MKLSSYPGPASARLVPSPPPESSQFPAHFRAVHASLWHNMRHSAASTSETSMCDPEPEEQGGGEAGRFCFWLLASLLVPSAAERSRPVLRGTRTVSHARRSQSRSVAVVFV